MGPVVVRGLEDRQCPPTPPRHVWRQRSCFRVCTKRSAMPFVSGRWRYGDVHKVLPPGQLGRPRCNCGPWSLIRKAVPPAAPSRAAVPVRLVTWTPSGRGQPRHCGTVVHHHRIAYHTAPPLVLPATPARAEPRSPLTLGQRLLSRRAGRCQMPRPPGLRGRRSSGTRRNPRRLSCHARHVPLAPARHLPPARLAHRWPACAANLSANGWARPGAGPGAGCGGDGPGGLRV